MISSQIQVLAKWFILITSASVALRVLVFFSYSEKWTIQHFENWLRKSPEMVEFERLTSFVQTRIEELQNQPDCSAPNFLCGHFDQCGFGCQMSHRIACTALSLIFGMPFIHDQITGWPHKELWNTLLLPIGSQCTPGPNTWTWNWTFRPKNATNKFNFLERKNASGVIVERIPYPFAEGLDVPIDMQNLAESINKNTFNYWLGQFTKYVFKLNPLMEQKTRVWRKQIGFDGEGPTVGLHIRRTDKIPEFQGVSHHSVEDYFAHAATFFDTSGSKFKRRVFVASEDAAILPEAKEKFRGPGWDVVGFESNTTIKVQWERQDVFEEIVRDLFLLTECDYVVCGMTSNICRIVLQIFNSRYPDGDSRVVSLDGTYELGLQAGHSLRKMKNTI